MKIKIHPYPIRKPEDTWFWLRARGGDLWHLRRYEMNYGKQPIAVCGWRGHKSYDHAGNINGNCSSHYLTREPAFDWVQYYLDHRRTEEFCESCMEVLDEEN